MVARDDAAYAEFVAASQVRLRRIAFLMTADWVAAGEATRAALVDLYVAWPRAERYGGVAVLARRALMTAIADRRPAVAADNPLVLALAVLPRQQRASIVLQHYDGLSVVDTARALQCSERDVTEATERGIAALERAFADRGLAAPTLGVM